MPALRGVGVAAAAAHGQDRTLVIFDVLLTDRADGRTLFQCVVPFAALPDALAICSKIIQRARFTLNAPITLEVRNRP